MVEGTAQRLDELSPRCDEGVHREGEFQPCEKVAVAVRIDPTEGSPYAVCAYHARGEMVPLSSLIGLVRGQAVALQAATERIDATVELLREAAQDINILPFLRALGVVAALGVGVPDEPATVYGRLVKTAEEYRSLPDSVKPVITNPPRPGPVTSVDPPKETQ